MGNTTKSLVRSFAKTTVAFAAMWFLMATAPVAAKAPEFDACSQCYENLSTAACAGVVNTAISTCCGQGGGWAWCVNREWGFYVHCNSEVGTRECQCSYGGDNCDSEFRLE